jgi:periplasmic protein TonB
MEPKKNPRIDLQKKSPLFLQLGLIAALSASLLAFELKQPEKAPQYLPGDGGGKTQLDEKVLFTKQEKPQSNPIRQIPLTMLDIRDNISDDAPELMLELLNRISDELPPFIPPKIGGEASLPDDSPILIPDVFASFKGGEEALFKWLKGNIIYPDEAKQINLQGTVYVRFVVEKDGTITNVSVAQGNVGGGCEEIAVEAVRRMPVWNPAKQRNRPVASWFVLPVEFRLQR